MKILTNNAKKRKHQATTNKAKYCSIPHAAELLGVGTSTIHKLIRDGQIATIRYSQKTHPRVILASVEALINGRS